MATYHLSNGQRLNIGTDKFLIIPENTTIPEIPLHPTTPNIPSTITAFNYDDLKNIALALIQQFGVTIQVHTSNKDVNPATPWDRTNTEVIFPAYAVKLSIPYAERQLENDRKDVKGRFLIGSENLIRIEDWFIFTDSKYTVSELNRLDPGGIILAYEVICI